MRFDLNRHIVRPVALLLCALGGLAVILAFTGPWIGLGVDEKSLFYTWFGLPRADLAILGAEASAIGTGVAVLAYSRHRGRLVDNTIALGAILASLLVLEAVTRLIDGRPVLAFRNWVSERNALLTTATMAEYDPVVGWVMKSGQSVNADDPVMSFSTGPHGIRLNRPDRGPPPSGAVLAVGDSFTAGYGVGDRD